MTKIAASGLLAGSLLLVFQPVFATSTLPPDSGGSCPAHGQQMLFIDFDGATLTPGNDAAPSGRSRLIDPAHGTVAIPPANLTVEERRTVMAFVHEAFAGFEIFVTDDTGLRYDSYSTVVVGGREALLRPGGADGPGDALVDCQNVLGSDVAVVYAEKILSGMLGRPELLQQLATAVVHESGHLLGLVDVNDPTDVMSPVADPARQHLFSDRLIAVPEGSVAVACSGTYAQNAARTLASTLGLRGCQQGYLGTYGSFDGLGNDAQRGCTLTPGAGRRRSGDGGVQWASWLTVIFAIGLALRFRHRMRSQAGLHSGLLGIALCLAGIGGADAEEGAPVCSREKTTLYLNFDGARLYRGQDNAVLRLSSFVDTKRSPADIPASPLSTEERSSTLNLVREAFAPFYIDVVDKLPEPREPYPQAGYTVPTPYAMVLIGGGEAMLREDPKGRSGLSSVSCGFFGSSDLGVVFFEETLARSPMRNNLAGNLATAIVHEAGHLFGLNDTKEPSDVMYPEPHPSRTHKFQVGELEMADNFTRCFESDWNRQNNHDHLRAMLGLTDCAGEFLPASDFTDGAPPSGCSSANVGAAVGKTGLPVLLFVLTVSLVSMVRRARYQLQGAREVRR